QVRGRQGNRRGVRRPLHVDRDALSLQLRLHPENALRRRRSVRRAGDLAGAAHHRSGRALPADRHAQDGRRGGRRRQDSGRAHRQAVRALSVDPVAARPAGDHDAADRALLRALQGPRAREMGAHLELDGCGRSQEGDPRQHRALRRASRGILTSSAHRQRELLFPWLFVVLWSTGFIAAKYGLPYAPPLTFLWYRFLFVAALMLPVAAITRAPWPDSPMQVLHVAIAAWLVNGAYLGGVFVAMSQGMTAGTSSMLVGLQPILTVVIARAWFGETVSLRQWIGLVLG